VSPSRRQPGDSSFGAADPPSSFVSKRYHGRSLAEQTFTAIVVESSMRVSGEHPCRHAGTVGPAADPRRADVLRPPSR